MTTYRTTSDEAVLIELSPRGNPMLLEENLARSRMHDAEIYARQHRLAHRLVVARRWRRLAGWAERRARLKARTL
ncbi:hypothetical protein [Saccharothrix longispora]|uniref:hypothetical protein n=1 Tax=Saccharothrix longispora TaxID=33920 RepID=UPI0028FD3E1A|nr:hypothetical protein [Saccharothrix longispora]MBY8852437.1 hypothetical protein [Saccharothrix sp. MB29]MDU0291355.1 hypothetical protein [Saccharothrix longispora]